MDDLVAQARTRVVKPSGEQLMCTIGVSIPLQQKTGEYGCRLDLPDAEEPRTIYGVDSLQSLSLAMRFAADRVDDLISQGWHFYFEDSDDRFPFEAYFIPGAWTKRLESIVEQAEQAMPSNRRSRSKSKSA